MNTLQTSRSDSLLYSPLKTPIRRRKADADMSNLSESGASEISPSSTPAFSLFAPISAPALRSVDLVEIAPFCQERERYELEILSEHAEVPSLKNLP